MISGLWLMTLQLTHGHQRRCDRQKCLAGRALALYILLKECMIKVLIVFLCAGAHRACAYAQTLKFLMQDAHAALTYFV